MDKLPEEKVREIRKMSTPRLVAKLIKVGYEEETLGDMSRERMIEEWAECVIAGKDQSDPVAEGITFRPTVAMADAEMQKQWIAIEQQRLELKSREIDLKQREMEILARKDKDERERKDKLASQMKYFHVAMKNLFSKFPHDPAELPAFFDHVENLFAMYEVPYSLRGPLLQAQLSDKAKAFIVRLSREQLDDYEQLKAFILNEFRITPLQLRERFYTLRKVPDESYSMSQSKLANALTFYLRSRKIDGSFEGLFNLICSDRLKELIPKSCLDFVLMQEKDEWLRSAQLSAVIDTYLASHFSDGRPKGPVTPVVYKDENSSRKPFSSSTTTTAVEAESKNDHVSVDKSSHNLGARRCFVCGGPHFKRDCPTRKEGNSNHSDASGNSGSGRKFNLQPRPTHVRRASKLQTSRTFNARRLQCRKVVTLRRVDASLCRRS
jgi:hypothetical protein